jgi:hypothetical protein
METGRAGGYHDPVEPLFLDILFDLFLARIGAGV